MLHLQYDIMIHSYNKKVGTLALALILTIASGVFSRGEGSGSLIVCEKTPQKQISLHHQHCCESQAYPVGAKDEQHRDQSRRGDACLCCTIAPQNTEPSALSVRSYTIRKQLQPAASLPAISVNSTSLKDAERTIKTDHSCSGAFASGQVQSYTFCYPADLIHTSVDVRSAHPSRTICFFKNREIL